MGSAILYYNGNCHNRIESETYDVANAPKPVLTRFLGRKHYYLTQTQNGSKLPVQPSDHHIYSTEVSRY